MPHTVRRVHATLGTLHAALGPERPGRNGRAHAPERPFWIQNGRSASSVARTWPFQTECGMHPAVPGLCVAYAPGRVLLSTSIQHQRRTYGNSIHDSFGLEAMSSADAMEDGNNGTHKRGDAQLEEEEEEADDDGDCSLSELHAIAAKGASKVEQPALGLETSTKNKVDLFASRSPKPARLLGTSSLVMNRPHLFGTPQSSGDIKLCFVEDIQLQKNEFMICLN
jgi:hypothetical protein